MDALGKLAELERSVSFVCLLVLSCFLRESSQGFRVKENYVVSNVYVAGRNRCYCVMFDYICKGAQTFCEIPT